MFGWRKRNDGFVWNEYVRTTILIRREDRRAKLEQVRDSAIEGAKQASRAGAAAAASGSRSAALAIVRALAAAYYAITDALIVAASATWLWLAATLSRSSVAQRWYALAASPKVAVASLLLGAVFAVASYRRISDHGLDLEAAITATIATFELGFVLLPHVVHGLAARSLSAFWPRGLSADLGRAVQLGALLALIGALLVWLVPALTAGTPQPDARDGARVMTPVTKPAQDGADQKQPRSHKPRHRH